jgi:hypothetical protein
VPKNTALDILKRWQALDAALAGEGLHVAAFARGAGVSPKTVYRDLEVFRELGQDIYHQVRSGAGAAFAWEATLWHYARGTRPLFTANLAGVD